MSWTVQHAFGRVSPASADYVPPAWLPVMVTEARIKLGVYVVVLVAAWQSQTLLMLLVCWLAPRLAGEPVQRILRVAEHVCCAENTNLLANTRTTQSNVLVNWIAWQMPYHAEHHLYPNVPFHALPELHRSTEPHVVVERGGYVMGQLRIIRWLMRDRSDPATSGAMS